MAPLAPEFVGTLQAIPGLISLLFLKTALDNRHKTGSRSFGLFAVGVFVYSLGLTAGNFTGDYWLSIWAWNLSLLGAQLLAVSWFTLAARVTGRINLTQPIVGLLVGYVVGLQLLIWTNPLHRIVYTPGELRGGVVFETAALNEGFWLLFGGAYLLVTIAMAVLVFEVVQSSGLRRRQTTTLAVGILPTIGANLLATNGLGLGSHDITVFGYVITALFFGIALYSDRFLDIVPVGRRTVIGEIDDAVVTVDEDDRIVDSNTAARTLFDIEEDYVGTAVEDVFAPLPTEIRTELVTATDLDTEVTVGLDGERRHFSVSVSAIGEAGGSGRVFVLRDITAQNHRETQLQRQNERLEQFASVVSHDLRNPLNVAEGRLELAREEVDSEHLDDVAAAHERMGAMIEDLLTLARTGETVTEPEPVELAAVAREAWTNADTDNCALTVAAPEGVTLRADRDRLLHVFENLFRNSVEHGSTSPRSGTPEDTVEHGSTGSPTGPDDPTDHDDPPVTVRVGVLDANGDPADGGRGAGFFVEDDGDGIPAETRDRVFEYGFTTGDGGTGFGLSIVRDIVEAHGWEIRVTEATGGGARFEITGAELER